MSGDQPNRNQIAVTRTSMSRKNIDRLLAITAWTAILVIAFATSGYGKHLTRYLRSS